MQAKAHSLRGCATKTGCVRPQCGFNKAHRLRGCATLGAGGFFVLGGVGFVGRASYSMEFSHYDYVPNELAEKVIATHKAAHGEQLVEEEA